MSQNTVSTGRRASAKEPGPATLLVDEAQELARTEASEDVARSLRTALTKHRDRVRVVYTGSSRSRLSHMFSDPQAPLYAPGLGVIDFPLLGRDLVDFAAQKFSEATGGTRVLDTDAGMALLTTMQHRPEPFLRAVMHLLASPGSTLQQASKYVVKAEAEQDDYEGTWRSLTDVQREVLKLSLAPDFKPFARATAQAIAANLGLEQLPLSTLQSAMRVMDDNNVLSKSPRGTYEFDDHLFRSWVETRIVQRARKKR